jgi:hypothetical protein
LTLTSAHAPFLPRRHGGGTRVRRVRGRLVGNPRDRYRAGPRRPGQASSRALPEKSSPGPVRVPWVAISAPALRRFLSRSDLWLPAAPLPERRSHLEALGRSAVPRHCWRFAANGLPGPPGSRAIRSPSGRRSLPRGEVNGPIHVPSQAATRTL